MDLLARTTWALVCVALGFQLGCGGREPEPPFPTPVDADGDGRAVNLDCDDHDPAVWRAVRGYEELDGDGHGDLERPVTCVGDGSEGWTEQQGDCAPQDATRWRWPAQAVYPDLDGDGATGPGPVWLCVGDTLQGYREQAGEPDCDDQDPRSWHSELAWVDSDGDGVGAGTPIRWCTGQGRTPPAGHVLVSGDCAPGDARRWHMLPYAYRDEDQDGFTVPQAGTVCAGTALPPGHATHSIQTDCDDRNRNRTVPIERWADTDGDGVGEGDPILRCISPGESIPGEVFQGGDCGPGDGTRWQYLAFASRDVDFDGYLAPASGLRCSGFWLPSGFSASVVNDDCDDRDVTRFRTWSVHADSDRDGVGAGPATAICGGAQVPTGYATTDTDCAAADAARWRMLAYAFRDADGDTFTVEQAGELCAGVSLPAGHATDAMSGPDCDDTNASRYQTVSAFTDTDGDGVGAGASTALCTNGQVPPPWSSLGTDCAAEDATRWRDLTASLADQDGDGFTAPIPATLVCTGAALPAPYHAKAVGNDCDDADPDLYRWMVLYPDRDGDGVGAPPRQVSCIGQAIPGGLSVYGDDTDDQDPVRQEDPDEADEVGLILDL
ncbi:MAG: hypothetical protein EOO72_01335 [Myxococcaceae bacterium]|nr:MAG: hypothetical protein EOO72_01335 [Myxococcaceae bacterium]